MTVISMAAFIEKVRSGLYQEHELVRFIMCLLILPPQTGWLAEEHLTIEDLLNGRFNAEQAPTVEAIFTNWNMRLGVHLFKIN